MWLSVWSKVQVVCVWSSWCHCIPKSHHHLPHLNPDWFYLSGTGLPIRLSWKECSSCSSSSSSSSVALVSRENMETFDTPHASTPNCCKVIDCQTVRLHAVYVEFVVTCVQMYLAELLVNCLCLSLRCCRSASVSYSSSLTNCVWLPVNDILSVPTRSSLL